MRHEAIMYYRALLFASSLLFFGCSKNRTSTRCSMAWGDDMGGTLICRTGDGSTTTIINQWPPDGGSPTALVASWVDNGPGGGKAYRSKFKAMDGGHYTTSLDLADLSSVVSLSLSVHVVADVKFASAVVQSNNMTGDVDLVSTSSELAGSSIELWGPFDVDRHTYNYRLDINVGPGGGGDIDVLSPPMVVYAKP